MIRNEGRDRVATLVPLLSALLLSIVSTTGCQTTPEDNPFETYSRVSEADVIAPVEIGHLRRRTLHEIPDPALGVQIRYLDEAMPGLRIDVFVYPITLHEHASLADLLTISIQGLVQEMDMAGRQLGLVYGEPVIWHFPSDGVPTGLLLHRDVETSESNRERTRSYGFLAIRDDTIWKLRLTGSAEDLSGLDSYVSDLLGALFSAVRLAPDAKPKFDLSVTVLANATAAAAGSQCALGFFLVYGFEMMKAIDGGEYLDTYDRERRARRAALDIWRERKTRAEDGDDCEHESLDAMLAADDADYFDEYVFTAYAAPWWSRPEGLDVDAFAEWANASLPVHDPIVFPGVIIKRKGETTP